MELSSTALNSLFYFLIFDYGVGLKFLASEDCPLEVFHRPLLFLLSQTLSEKVWLVKLPLLLFITEIEKSETI